MTIGLCSDSQAVGEGPTPPPSRAPLPFTESPAQPQVGRGWLGSLHPSLAAAIRRTRALRGWGPLAGGRCQSREGVWWGWALGPPRVEAAHCVCRVVDELEPPLACF